MQFRFKGLEGFHPDVKEAIAANPAVLAGFVLAELDYKVRGLDEPIKLNRFEDLELQDYLHWLKANGAQGEFPLQLLLADTPTRRKDWAKRHVDPAEVAETISNMPDSMLTEYHPMIEVWSNVQQAGVPVDQVVLVSDVVVGDKLSPTLRMYPFVQRLTLEDVVVVNALLAAIAPSMSIERAGFCSFDGPLPPDILTLTRLLFDRGYPLEVAYLPDRIEVFHKAPTEQTEKVARAHVAKAFPTPTKPNPLPDGLLPADAPTAFDLPKGAAFDQATDVMSMLAKLTSHDAQPTMEEAEAFNKAVQNMVGVPKAGTP